MYSGNHIADMEGQAYQDRGKCDCGVNDWQDVNRCEYDETRDCDRHCVNHTDQCRPTAFKVCNACGEIREAL